MEQGKRDARDGRFSGEEEERGFSSGIQQLEDRHLMGEHQHTKSRQSQGRHGHRLTQTVPSPSPSCTSHPGLIFNTNSHYWSSPTQAAEVWGPAALADGVYNVLQLFPSASWPAKTWGSISAPSGSSTPSKDKDIPATLSSRESRQEATTSPSLAPPGRPR